MSSSLPEVINDSSRPALAGDRLAELVSVIAEAPDFSTAATFLVAQFVDVAAAHRGVVLALDADNERLQVVAAVGYGAAGAPSIQVRIDDPLHPLAIAALSLHPIECGGPAIAHLPFEEWVAIPFPQPQFRGAPALLSERAAAEKSLPGCRIRAGTPRERRRRLGHAPFGLVILDTVLSDDVVVELSYAAALAGPVLSRMSAVEEFRRSAERLDQQRDLLTAIVNSLPDPIIITNAAADIVVQNRRAEHLLSIGEGDSEGRRRAVEINNLLFTSHLAKAAMGGGPQAGSRELNMVDPDEGADLLFEVLTHALPGDEDGAAGSMVSVLRDVTDLRRAAGELERQVQRARLAESDVTRERDRLDLILENVADPILVTDDRSDIILMNRQAEQLFSLETGGEDRRAYARRAAAVRANDMRFTSFISDFTLSQDASRRQEMELVIPHTGNSLPVEVVSGKITNERGEPLAIVSVLHDLTEQAENERLYDELKKFSGQLEERIREATADLEEQNARLQWQSQELEKANRLKSEFLASMSHELRTPINALIGYTSLLLDRIYGDINDQQYDALTRVQIAAQHLLALINDILDLAKIEAGRMPLHLEDVRLDDLIYEITAQVDPLVRKKGLSFTADVAPGTPVMFTDRVKVKQILLNLLSNAIKFTHSGTISIHANAAAEGRIEIAVRDTGIGIKEEHREAIWEDFRQVDQSITREFGGTGLGLSITRKLVEALGGDVRLESEFRRGSTFTVILPQRSSSQEGDLSLPAAGGRSATAEAGSGRREQS